jgi:hypothetical protein
MRVLSPHAFITVADAQARLKRTEGAEDDIEQRCIDAINDATSWMESITRRNLKARNYRTAVVKTCSASSGSQTMTGTGFTADLEVGDDAVGHANLDAGNFVQSIESATSLTLSRETLGAISSQSITFGSRPLRVSGDGTSELYLPERPIVEVFAAYSTDAAGTDTAIDLSSALYDFEVGRIRLTSGVFPKGELNIRVEARLGYVQPSATDRGHVDWYSLERIAYRATEVFFMDALNLRGRAMDVRTTGTQYGTQAMPADLEAAIRQFVRLW